jgi:hypothetical protein
LQFVYTLRAALGSLFIPSTLLLGVMKKEEVPGGGEGYRNIFSLSNMEVLEKDLAHTFTVKLLVLVSLRALLYLHHYAYAATFKTLALKTRY